MLTFNDMAYCNAPSCKNKCGRKMTEKEKKDAENSSFPICYGLFCDENGNVIKDESVQM